jgi:hypothetical protein
MKLFRASAAAKYLIRVLLKIIDYNRELNTTQTWNQYAPALSSV